MIEYKILTGNAQECENKMNLLAKDYWLVVESMSKHENEITVLLSMTPRQQ